MDRKIREKIKNVFENIFFNCFWNGPDLKQNWVGADPNKIQTILYWAGLSPVAWTGLMIQPRLVTVLINQVIIFPCLQKHAQCMFCIQEDETGNKDEGEGITWNGGALAAGLTVVGGDGGGEEQRYFTARNGGSCGGDCSSLSFCFFLYLSPSFCHRPSLILFSSFWLGFFICFHSPLCLGYSLFSFPSYLFYFRFFPSSFFCFLLFLRLLISIPLSAFVCSSSSSLFFFRPLYSVLFSFSFIFLALFPSTFGCSLLPPSVRFLLSLSHIRPFSFFLFPLPRFVPPLCIYRRMKRGAPYPCHDVG